MPITFIDPLSDQFVNSHPNASFFHSSSWLRVLHETYGFKPNSIVLVKNGQIRGLLPFMETRGIFGKKRCVSLPFSDFCEPLFDNQDDFKKVFEVLVRQAENKCWQFIQLRGGEQWLENANTFTPMYTHDIDLNRDEKEIFASFRPSTCRNIRKAQKENISVTYNTDLQGMRDFYWLNSLTHRDHGLPHQPWNFFFNIWRLIINNAKGFIIQASFKGKPIAGNVFFLNEGKVIFKYSASDKKFQHLRPNNLTMWEGIKKCRELKCKILNLGRTEQHHTGLLQFKHGFGCNETSINFYRYDIQKGKFISRKNLSIGGIRTRILSKLPISVLRFMGNYLYKYVE